MKARNKKTGEIVEYYITNHYKTDEEFYFTKQDSAMNYGEFNELYEAIPQTGLGVNDDTSKKDDILVDPNHPHGGMETWEDRFDNTFDLKSTHHLVKGFFAEELEKQREEIIKLALENKDKFYYFEEYENGDYTYYFNDKEFINLIKSHDKTS